MADLAGAKSYRGPLVNEGGAIHVDGEGTVLLTETVQPGPERNPHWSRAGRGGDPRPPRHPQGRLAAARPDRRPPLPAARGARGTTGGYGTLGHVDIVAAFARPGVVVAHRQPDPAHPAHEVTEEAIGILRAATHARGRSLEVVEVPAPTVLEADGHWAASSYIDHYERVMAHVREFLADALLAPAVPAV
ncbi:agmatine deiminase family protein [Streptomyces sp. TG1A-8]|uniref:agmatine deiminase family protein n=1 Tax=Streptomyces sp. TG1A-8 TaxID=3051385 RepID=UPI00265C670D|nr:agmatine deiminase family protein [Streptomyces sp. TG1A-8]MDO0925581.1 agmatine deiminase family protein [Streptomyces sp. TG1A-8]